MNVSRGGSLAVLLLVSLLVIPPAGSASPVQPRTLPSALAPLAGPNPLSPAYGADTWLEFQHDNANTGLSGDTPVASGLAWNATLRSFGDGYDAPYVGSPVVGNGNVYMPEGDNVTAYNASTGAVLWSTPLTPMGGSPHIVETPLLWRGWVVVAEDTPATAGFGFPNCGVGAGPPPCSSFYLLNATTGAIAQSVPQGTDNWGGDPVPGSPVPIVGPAFGGDQGFLLLDHMGYLYSYAWDGTTLTAVGNDQAVRQGGTRTTSTPSVAYVPGQGWGAFFLDGLGNQRVDAVQLSAGAALPFLWGGPVGPGLGGGVNLAWTSTNTGSISVANVTARGGPYPIGFFGDDAGAGATSLLVALNLTTHVPLATQQLLTAGAPTVDNGMLSTPVVVPINSTAVGLIVTDLNGSVSRYNFTYNAVGGAAAPSWMNLSWNVRTGSRIEGSPAVAGNTVYVGNGAGGLFALDVATGAKVWNATLSAPIRSNFALGYSRLYAVSDPLGGGKTGNLTAFGSPAGPRRGTLSAAVAATSPIGSGTTSLLVVHATWVGSRGGGPASGATVNLSAPLGTFQSPSVAVDAQGYAYDNWTAPAISPVWYNVTVSSSVWAPYNTSAAASTTIEVRPGGPPSYSPLSLSVSPATSGPLLGGATLPLTFSATTTGGLPVKGVSIVLRLSGLGSLSAPGPLTTGTNGQATDTYLAPATISSGSTSLLTANGTLTGYIPASSAAAISLAAPGSNGGSPTPVTWTASATPTTLDLAEGATGQVSVQFENTSSGSPVPIMGLSVSGSTGGSLSGSLVAPSGTTNALGWVDFNFTASTTPGAALLSFSGALARGSASVSVSVAVAATSPPSSGSVTWSASAAPSAVAIYGGNTTTVAVTFLNTSSSPAVPLSGVSVSATASSSASGTLAVSTATTDSQGVADFTFRATQVPGAVLLTFSASQGRASASASVSISVFNPGASTSTKTGSSTPSSLLGLSYLDWLLLLLVVVLAILLIVALSRRKPREALPPSAGGPESAYLESPRAGPPGPAAPEASSGSPPHLWAAPPEVLAAAPATKSSPAPSPSTVAEPAPAPAPENLPEEETGPITVEEVPESTEEDAGLGTIDHEKLAEHLGAALVAAGPDDVPSPEQEAPAAAGEPTPSEEPEAAAASGDASPPEADTASSDEPTDASSAEDQSSKPSKPMMPLRRKNKGS